MLTDITALTCKVLREIRTEEKKLTSAQAIYDVYRDLFKVIDSVSLVTNHYLALDFTEHYLQNSSWGAPVDKWRKFFNQDLEYLNEAIKKYFLDLSRLALKQHEDDDRAFNGIVEQYYSPKTYYAFVRDRYNIGYVEPCGSMLYITALKKKTVNQNDPYIENFLKIDLSTFESKQALQLSLNEQNEKLKVEYKLLKEYILKHYTIDDLL